MANGAKNVREQSLGDGERSVLMQEKIEPKVRCRHCSRNYCYRRLTIDLYPISKSAKNPVVANNGRIKTKFTVTFRLSLPHLNFL